MNEECIVWNLIFGQFKDLEKEVHSWIDSFYKDYDPRTSLDKTYIFNLFAELSYYFGNIKEELKYHG